MASRLCGAWCLVVLVAVVLLLGSAKTMRLMRGADCHSYFFGEGDSSFLIPHTNVRPEEDFITNAQVFKIEMRLRYYFDMVLNYPSIGAVSGDEGYVFRNMSLRECLVEQWLSDEEKKQVIYPIADISYSLHKGAYVFSNNDSLQSYVVRCPELPLFYMRRSS